MSKFWAADSDDSSSESSSDDSSSSSSSSGGGKAGGDRWVMDSDSGEFTLTRRDRVSSAGAFETGR